MLGLNHAVNIYSEMDRMLNKGDSGYLSSTVRHTTHEICEHMKILNSSNKVYSIMCLDIKNFINTLKVDGEKVISYKNVKKIYNNYSRDKEYVVNKNRILELATPAPFGKGTETVFDENVRKAFEIHADRMEITGDDEILQKNFKEMLPRNKKFSYKLYKMQIYKEGGKFNRHKDTIHSPNHYGTLVINIQKKILH
uniref:Prolyl 4-hydroxylase alpha subunit Fe(2+) 2OG dioxygenase domain-containing protein n=1 Tax=viral metagenome TaxID=1070528 RepID=A0A6C0E1X5_9ZZZZ